MVQLSHQYMTTGKTIALTKWTFVSKVMCLLFNLLFRFTPVFLPGEFHGQEPGGLQSMGSERAGHD